MGSKMAVIVALIANLANTAVKTVAAIASGSAGLLAEAIHSAVDTCDSLLLMLGKKRSKRPPDALHPFGHGKELYFWVLMVAMMLFTAGGCAAIVEGILRFVNPEPIEKPGWTYAVLIAAAIFEGTAFLYALHTFQKHRRRELKGYSFWRAIRAAKDPTLFAIVFEDGAGFVGVLIALAGVTLSLVLNEPRWDAASSIAIGTLLGATALVLATECRKLLIGERALPTLVEGVRNIAREQSGVRSVRDVRTMHLGPDSVWVALELEFTQFMLAPAAIQRIEQQVRARFAEVHRVSIDAASF